VSDCLADNAKKKARLAELRTFVAASSAYASKIKTSNQSEQNKI